MVKVKICCIQSIAEANEEVKPFGVDVCSGVRTNGDLDDMKVRRFIDEVN